MRNHTCVCVSLFSSLFQTFYAHTKQCILITKKTPTHGFELVFPLINADWSTMDVRCAQKPKFNDTTNQNPRTASLVVGWSHQFIRLVGQRVVLKILKRTGKSSIWLNMLNNDHSFTGILIEFFSVCFMNVLCLSSVANELPFFSKKYWLNFGSEWMVLFKYQSKVFWLPVTFSTFLC